MKNKISNKLEETNGENIEETRKGEKTFSVVSRNKGVRARVCEGVLMCVNEMCVYVNADVFMYMCVSV